MCCLICASEAGGGASSCDEDPLLEFGGASVLIVLPLVVSYSNNEFGLLGPEEMAHGS